MKQPDRVERTSTKGVDLQFIGIAGKSIFANLGLALGSFLVFRYLLPVFFRGGGTLTDGGIMATINVDLASAMEAASVYVGGAFLLLSLLSVLAYLWAKLRNLK